MLVEPVVGVQDADILEVLLVDKLGELKPHDEGHRQQQQPKDDDSHATHAFGHGLLELRHVGFVGRSTERVTGLVMGEEQQEKVLELEEK